MRGLGHFLANAKLTAKVGPCAAVRGCNEVPVFALAWRGDWRCSLAYIAQYSRKCGEQAQRRQAEAQQVFFADPVVQFHTIHLFSVGRMHSYDMSVRQHVCKSNAPLIPYTGMRGDYGVQAQRGRGARVYDENFCLFWTIAAGKAADLLLPDDDWSLRAVILGGRVFDPQMQEYLQDNIQR